MKFQKIKETVNLTPETKLENDVNVISIQSSLKQENAQPSIKLDHTEKLENEEIDQWDGICSSDEEENTLDQHQLNMFQRIYIMISRWSNDLSVQYLRPDLTKKSENPKKSTNENIPLVYQKLLQDSKTQHSNKTAKAMRLPTRKKSRFLQESKGTDQGADQKPENKKIDHKERSILVHARLNSDDHARLTHTWKHISDALKQFLRDWKIPFHATFESIMYDYLKSMKHNSQVQSFSSLEWNIIVSIFFTLLFEHGHFQKVEFQFPMKSRQDVIDYMVRKSRNSLQPFHAQLLFEEMVTRY